MFRQSSTPIVLLAAAFLALPAVAAEFRFDVPELTSSYHGEHGNRHVHLDLGTSFTHIDAVSLHLVGTHTPGLIRLLSHHAEDEPYPAEVIGRFPEAGPYFTTAFDEILPSEGGPFDVTFDFKNLNGPGREPNFDPLLDGQALLNVSVAGPPVIAIYSIKSLPQVTVDSAMLIISGQAAHYGHIVHGDYDHNGHVDTADYVLWRATMGSSTDLRADGNGDGMIDAADYAVWRRGMTAGSASDASLAAAVPEPHAIWLAVIALFSMAARRRP